MSKLPDQKTILEVFRLLSLEYPNPKTELIYDSSFQLLIAVILSAQCTDARVNLVTPELFRQYPTARAMAGAKIKSLETLIHSCGFYRMKAKSIQNASRDLITRFEGELPKTLEELITLAGVGRKTASVVLNQAFDIPAIAVDTHVKRVSHRLGWTDQSSPEKIERDLKDLVPQKLWSQINGLLILHGRKICKARKPACEACFVNTYCRYYGKEFTPIKLRDAAAPEKRSRSSRRQSLKTHKTHTL